MWTALRRLVSFRNDYVIRTLVELYLETVIHISHRGVCVCVYIAEVGVYLNITESGIRKISSVPLRKSAISS